MNAVSYDVKDMLEASGLGLEYKKNLFISLEPDLPDNCVTIYDTPGFSPDYTLDVDTELYHRSACQVRIRNNSYSTGVQLGWNIMNWLHGRANSTWNSTVYTVIEATGEPAPMARDNSNRVIIIINFNLQRR